jgi:tripartite-type tricarboxylate transporter receptor subunit TctC
VRELIALAKAQSGKLTYASSCSGYSLHLAAELFKQMAGVDIVHIPYKGAAPAAARAYRANEIEKWGKLVRRIGAKVE